VVLYLGLWLLDLVVCFNGYAQYNSIYIGKKTMYIVHVHVHVKFDQIETFIASTKENAGKSVANEQGVARFDIIQQADDPTRFVLLEGYRTPEDAARHKETEHYNRWREVVEPMMAEPRTRVVYKNIFPSDLGYSISLGD
jgi:(4S)-4-hydroxy-5-phosphonooxypentane-2,3-dione isomerase